MHEFWHCGRLLALAHGARQGNGSLRAWMPLRPLPPDIEDLMRLLRACDAQALRQLLPLDGGWGEWRVTDAEVFRQAAYAVQRRALQLFEVREPALFRMQQQSGSSPFTRAAMTPAQLHPRQDEPNPARKADTVEPVRMVDQGLQAQALRRAAAQGLPFCEECFKRQRALALT